MGKYKGIMFCSGEVGRELTPEEVKEIKKEIDKNKNKDFEIVKNILRVGDSLKVNDICESGCGGEVWEDIRIKLPNGRKSIN